MRDGSFSPMLSPAVLFEGMLYNVPNDKFTSSNADSVVHAMTGWRYMTTASCFVSILHWLVRTGQNTLWAPEVREVLAALQPFWKNWWF